MNVFRYAGNPTTKRQHEICMIMMMMMIKAVETVSGQVIEWHVVVQVNDALLH